MNVSDETCAPTELFNSTNDSELLRQYVADDRQDAFAEVVRRHLSLVYHAALRQLGDPNLAEDVTQVVFTDLARKASGLRHRTVLAGWLHTSTRFAASNFRRRQTRQQQRDEASFFMQEGTSEELVDWARLRPVIDDALYTLRERDREAVLLRFFEGYSFAQIGAKLALTEDSARVRVNRALEKLAGALRQRGMTSTAATLAVALGVETAAATPAGLVSHITTSALAASALGGAGLVSALYMKLAIGVTMTAAAAGVGLAVHASRTLHRVEEQLTASDRQRTELTSELENARRQLAEAKNRLDEESADTAKLLSAIASLRTASSKAPAEPVVPGQAVTAGYVQSRFRHAQRLVSEGQWEEALKEFLWCFDEGMVRIASFTGVRRSFLTSALGELAKQYPAARAAVEERLAAAEQKLNADPTDHDAPADFAALNHALGNDARTLAVFDQLAVDDPRRHGLGAVYLYDVFLNTQRYADAVRVRPYDSSLLTFTSMEQQLSKPAVPAPLAAAIRQNLVADAAKSAEALAGAGDLQHARDFVAKALAIDHSPQTVAMLQARLARAGHPEVVTVQ